MKFSKVGFKVILLACIIFVAVDGLSFNEFQVPEFVSVSSTSLKSTGKRSELGEAVHSLELRLPSGESIILRVKATTASLKSPDCLWTQSVGGKVVEQKPCPDVHTFEGVYEEEKVFLGYLDEEKTLLKGFFEYAGERFFIDPTFEHAHNLKLSNKFHLAKGPMMIYPEASSSSSSSSSRAANQTRSIQLLTEKKKRGIVAPEGGNVKYPANPFPGGECTLKKIMNLKLYIDHSYINRWNSDQSSFSDTFTPETGKSWSNRMAFLQIYTAAVSKYIYERSTGIRLVLSGVEEHPNAGDTPWNPAGTTNNGRYKCALDINGLLNTFSDWCKVDKSSCIPANSGGLNHLMTDCQRLYPGESGTIGLAWIGIICSNLNTGTCTHLPGRDGYQCTAHELGHNFGAPHDFRDGNTDIMSYQQKKYDGFSDQTFNAICKHLAGQGYKCMAENTQGPSQPPPRPPCAPNCNGKSCGDNGCGGQCGSCKFAQKCNGGKCQLSLIPCIANCMGKECGDNGCGGSCGTCEGGASCNPDLKKCAASAGCMPSCLNKGCGMSDGCGGTCGSGCNFLQRLTGMVCDSSTAFICSKKSKRSEQVFAPASSSSSAQCTPNCDGKTCGSDGCGGSCGVCGGRGTTCNTITSQCECVPQTTCEEQSKKCGVIYDGCGNVTCGDPCPPCTSNPNACVNKTCGYVSDGCDMVLCGACLSSSDAMTCVDHQCVRNDQCGACATDASCLNGRCTCRPGYIGNGFTCQAIETRDPFTPEAWSIQSGSLSDWSLSSDNKVFTNDVPSKNSNSPSLLRWTNSRSLMAATDINLEVNVQTRSAQAVAGLAIGLDGDKYVTVVLTNGKVLLHSGSVSSGSGLWYSLGDYANANVSANDSSTTFTKQWVGLSLSIRQHDTYTVALKGSANGRPFPSGDCGSGCVGINMTSYVQLYTAGAGDVGLFGLVDVSDFSGLRLSTSTKTFMTIGRCIPDSDLKKILSNVMGVDEVLIRDLNNSCTTKNQKKRSVEQAAAVTVSFTTVGTSPLSPSAIGPSIMASSLEVGGPLASSAASASITSVAPVSASVVSASVASVAVIAESAVVAGAGAGAALSTAAIAGIAVAGAVGLAVAAGASVVVAKKMQSDEPGKEYDQFEDRPSSPPTNPLVIETPLPPPSPPPSPSPSPSPGPSIPKGGKDILLTHMDGFHTSITGRGAPIAKDQPVSLKDKK